MTTIQTSSGSDLAPSRLTERFLRRTAFVAGALYLLTFVSIPTVALYGPILNDPDWVTGPGPDTPVVIGAVLEMIVALACVGTAVVLHPVVKRQNEATALAFVGSRTLEGATIIAGVASLLSLVSLQRAGAGTDALVSGQGLVANYNTFFLLGQSTMPVVNALLLGILLYRSRLVPRIIPLLGLIGAPLLLASNLGAMFGLWERNAGPAAVLFLPIALWELSLGVYLVVKGFRRSRLTADDGPTT